MQRSSRLFFIYVCTGLIVLGSSSVYLMQVESNEKQVKKSCLGKCFNSIKEYSSFFWEFVCNRGEVGAIMPSSLELAKAMTGPLKKSDIKETIHVLEVGPGTGVFTKEIIEFLQSKYPGKFVFDVVEINEKFCKKLNAKYGKVEGVNIHSMSIVDWKPDYQYDFIISGLPFNSLSLDIVDQTLSNYKNSIKSEGVVSYFEYEISRRWRELELKTKIFLSSFLCRCEKYKKKLQEFHDVLARVELFLECGVVQKEFVKKNVPEAWAIHVQF